jgi:hypothetical protein
MSVDMDVVRYADTGPDSDTFRRVLSESGLGEKNLRGISPVSSMECSISSISRRSLSGSGRSARRWRSASLR